MMLECLEASSPAERNCRSVEMPSVAAELTEVRSSRVIVHHNPGPTVLLVDGDRDLRNLLVADLRTKGLNPILARSQPNL